MKSPLGARAAFAFDTLPSAAAAAGAASPKPGILNMLMTFLAQPRSCACMAPYEIDSITVGGFAVACGTNGSSSAFRTALLRKKAACATEKPIPVEMETSKP